MIRVTKTSLFFEALVLCILLDGCGSTSNVGFDEQWDNGQLRSIIQTQHYSAPASSFGYTENSRRLIGEEWSVVTVPVPNPARLPEKKTVFLHLNEKDETAHEQSFPLMNGEQSFSLIRGTNLLIHHFLNDGWIGGTEKFTVFDPKAKKDISVPFPPSPAKCIFNRSGTICLTMANGMPVIVDVLSAQTGTQKVLATPLWFVIFQHWAWEKLRCVLTDDGQNLVLLPHSETSSYINQSNFNAEVWSVNGKKEIWPIPLDRKEESFVDAEAVDSQVLILSRTHDAEVKLINIKGETILSTKANIFPSSGELWDPARHEIFFSPFCIWNYKSNTMQNVSALRN